MKSRTIVAPSGERWVIALRWLPWSPRWRGLRLSRQERQRDTQPTESTESTESSSRWDWLDLADPFVMFDEGCLPVFGIALGIALVAGAILFVVPIFIFVAEITIVILAVVIGVVLRVVFRRPWLIDAVSSGGAPTELVWAVVGYRRSREAIDEIARQLEAGQEMPVAADATLVGSRALAKSS